MGPKASSSKSSSTSSTSSNTEDNKVTATDNAIALGKDSSFQYTDQFPDNVKSAFEDLVQLASDAGLAAMAFANKSIQANESAVKSAQETASRSQDLNVLGQGVLVRDVLPMLVLGVLGFGAIFAFKNIRLKK